MIIASMNSNMETSIANSSSYSSDSFAAYDSTILNFLNDRHALTTSKPYVSYQYYGLVG
jgi:hypothetical protein